ncbi:MAG: N-acetylornithine carbamoyltransferase [Planctomycetes bacterium]|nr:N-acetylornithine carbamoyltransferase [Planctomycetota bacterium]
MDQAGITGQASRHFHRLDDLSDRQIEDVLDLAARLKRGVSRPDLAGQTVGLLFFRPSLRTRTSLEVAMHQLGGHTVNLNAASDFWELEARDNRLMDGVAPEHIKDAAAALSCYVNAIAIRPALSGKSWTVDRKDEQIHSWMQHAGVPVINMESALWHPLQALADLLTLRETLGELKGKRLTIAWTASPTPSSPAVVHSILMAALRSGMDVRVAHPSGYELDSEVLEQARSMGQAAGAALETGLPLAEAATGAHVIYARSWWGLDTYGQPSLSAQQNFRASGWCVDDRVLEAGDDAHLMHPMPIRRNLEVSDRVLDGPRSLIIEQAANRLHTQKSLLSLLLRS